MKLPVKEEDTDNEYIPCSKLKKQKSFPSPITIEGKNNRPMKREKKNAIKKR